MTFKPKYRVKPEIIQFFELEDIEHTIENLTQKITSKLSEDMKKTSLKFKKYRLSTEQKTIFETFTSKISHINIQKIISTKFVIRRLLPDSCVIYNNESSGLNITQITV
jgi:hypothetical protein